MLEFFARSVDVVLTLEDHVLRGGFGSAVLEALSDLGITTPVARIGWPDQFIEHGKLDPLRAKYGLTVEAAIEKLAPYLEAGKPASKDKAAVRPLRSVRSVTYGSALSRGENENISRAAERPAIALWRPAGRKSAEGRHCLSPLCASTESLFPRSVSGRAAAGVVEPSEEFLVAR